MFIDCLNQAKTSGLLSGYFHLMQILWLNDERSIDLLVDLLPPDDKPRKFLWWITPQKVREHDVAKSNASSALSLLNSLESGHIVHCADRTPASYYRDRRNDPAFREMMLQSIHKSIAQMHLGH